MIPEQLMSDIDHQASLYEDFEEEESYWTIRIDDLKEILEKYFKEEPNY